MLLAIDIGNTNTVMGVFKGKELLNSWRISTIWERTADEHIVLMRGFLQFADIPYKNITGVSICCVVPPALYSVVRMCQKLWNIEPLVLSPGTKTGMPVLYENPREVGADRIANAVAAYNEYGGPVIIVDFGTATTFCVVNKKGEYLGGVIAPGIRISAEALFEKAAKLPRVELVKTDTVIGKNTVVSMQSGLFYGYLGLVEGILTRIFKELEEAESPVKKLRQNAASKKNKPFVIATGGLAVLLGNQSPLIDTVDLNLTLKGLRIIYEKNKSGKSK